MMAAIVLSFAPALQRRLHHEPESVPMNPQTAIKRTAVVDGQTVPETLDEAMIANVVHQFYAKVRRDPLIGPIFNTTIPDEGWPEHLATLCDFWSSLLLRSGRYEGRPLPPHLKIPGLDEAHFRRWLQLFRDTVQQLCPPEIVALFMDRAFRIAHSFRLAVAFNRGDDTMMIEPITTDAL